MFNFLLKLRSLSDKKDKIFLLTLSFLLSLSVLLEILGLILILPLISSMTEIEGLIDSQSDIYRILSLIPSSYLTVKNIFLFYFLRFIYLLVVVYLKNYFSNNFSSKVTKKLFKTYVMMPYEGLLQRDISSINKNLYAESYSINLYITSIISFVIDLTTTVTIISTLLIVDFYITTIILSVVLLICGFYIIITKNYVYDLGKQTESINSSIFKYLGETFNSIKDVIIYNYQRELIKEFSSKIDLKNKISTVIGTLGQSTRYFLEFLTLIIIFLVVYIMISKDYQTEKLTTVITLFGMGIIRALPAINGMLTATNNIKYTNHSTSLIFNELKSNKIDLNSTQKLKFKKSIKLLNITFNYDDKKLFEKFNLEINKGDFIGIKGVSGSGKTTLLDIISGLKTPVDGQILVDDKPIENNFVPWINQIAYVNQEALIIDKNIYENILFGSKKSSIKKIDSYLKKFDLLSIKNNLGENGINISGGQKQRISLIRAIIRERKVLLIDEPTSSQDKHQRRKIIETIGNLKGEKTLIMVSHNNEDLKNCDKVIELK
jgi:ATP-binding cassette, subfamily B, bacterial PglK